MRVADNTVLTSFSTGLGPRGVAVIAGTAGWEPGPDTSVSTGVLPGDFALEAVYPNPFNAAATVVFSLTGAPGQMRPVALSVHNPLGQTVRHLVDAQMDAGRHRVVWDGLDDRGRRLGSGAYFIRLQTPNGQALGKAMLLR